MFQFYQLLAYLYVSLFFLGAAAGCVSGLLAILVLDRRLSIGPSLFADAALGGSGVVCVMILITFVRIPLNTVVTDVAGVKITSTTDGYQHPLIPAALVATLVPFCFEIWRRRGRGGHA